MVDSYDTTKDIVNDEPKGIMLRAYDLNVLNSWISGTLIEVLQFFLPNEWTT